MRKILDKTGYILLLVCIGYLFIDVGKYGLFQVLLTCSSSHEETFLVVNDDVEDGKHVYTLESTEINRQQTTYRSLAIEKKIDVNTEIKGYIVPFFNRITFGKIGIAPTIIIIIFFLFMILVGYVSICMLLGIDNYFTKRIKEAYPI